MSRPAVRADIDDLEGYHSAQVDVEVRLNTNESPYGPPDEFRSAVSSALATAAWNRYPDRGAALLRSRIADLHGASASQVFAANGSNEVIQTVLLAFGGPGRDAATFEPTYALHRHLASITGTGHVTGERGPDFAVSDTELERVLAREPHIVFFCSPNNPTGNAERRDIVVEAVDRVAGWGGLVVVDEAYGQFSSWSALDLVASNRNVVVTRTFSKTWAMAGARLGYLLGPDWLVAELMKVVLPYHLDIVTQTVGVLALDHEAAMAARVASLIESRGSVVGALSRMDVDVWPSDANFVLFRPRRLDAEEVWQGLVDRSVLVRDCSSWPRLGGCLRVTVGTDAENDRFLEALGAVLDSGGSTEPTPTDRPEPPTTK